MLDPSQYKDPKLDSETQKQLFEVWVSQRFLELENKLNSYDDYFKNISGQLQKLQSNALEKPVDYSLVIKDLINRVRQLESVVASQKKFSIWDFIKR